MRLDSVVEDISGGIQTALIGSETLYLGII